MKKFTVLAVTILSFLIFQQNNLFAATGFAKPNLSGTWYVYITVSEITKTVTITTGDRPTTETIFTQNPGYVKGIIGIDKNGNVVSNISSLTYFDFQANPNEATLEVSGGNLNLAKNGTITGSIQIGNTGLEAIQIVDSKMDKGKTIISGVVKNIATVSDTETVATIGMISALKQ
ncbi:hypothetical protein [uncultured Desulfobulbus sp.]|uniref:hypothetical protein n=1 Tax=uncultured Desulfobulbus sp. TaxID=239745 RepID=UPI0029C8EB59|nr:hypothetical protein [uncultured Desulfobulbus sp.]